MGGTKGLWPGEVPTATKQQWAFNKAADAAPWRIDGDVQRRGASSKDDAEGRYGLGRRRESIHYLEHDPEPDDNRDGRAEETS
jgi:hypothetical protein